MSRRTRKLAPRTEALYQRTLVRAYGDKTPDYVPDLEGPSPWPETVRKQLCAAIRYYWERRDPVKGAAIVDGIAPGEKVQRTKLFPSLAEIEQYVAALPAAGPQALPVLRVMLGLGPRTEEIFDMPRAEAEQAVQTGRIVLDGKGNKRRELPASKAAAALRAMLATRTEEGGTWATPADLFGRRESVWGTKRNRLAACVARVAAAAGLSTDGWAPHRLRHVFATRMTGAGAPEAMVAYALGHTRGSVTQGYIHVTADQLLPYMVET